MVSALGTINFGDQEFSDLVDAVLKQGHKSQINAPISITDATKVKSQLNC